MWDLAQKKMIFYGVLSVLFLFLVVKLLHLQIYEGKKYFEYSEANRIRRDIIQPYRGLIYDRNGIVLVDNSPSYTLTVTPIEARHNPTLFDSLAPKVSASVSQLKNRVLTAESPFSSVRLARNVSYKAVVYVEERRLNLPGIGYEVEPKRIYPGGVRAPHLFGYIGEISRAELDQRTSQGLRPGDLVGKTGVEKAYDDYLRGELGVNYIEVDALGRGVKDIELEGEKQEVRGNDLYLTLDAGLQRLAESLFAERSGGIIMIDPRDGGILVLSSKPDYDPAIFTKVVSNKTWRKLVNDPRRPLFDRMIKSMYPPGSTYKLVTAAAGLETGVIDPDMTVFCPGYVRFGRRIFKCWKEDGHGRVDLLQAIEQSCNSYFYTQSLRVGLEAWSDASHRMGFGRPTGIDLPGERPGLVPDRDYLNKTYGKGKWTRGLLLNLGIGQGDLLVTPLQLAQYVMILANRGTWYTPHVLYKRYRTAERDTVYYQPRRHEVEEISDETFDALARGMYRVVNAEKGTGRASWVSGVEVAGKTGTAQNPHGESHAWFVGFAPYENPQVAICVFVENGGSGGAQAAPLAGQMLRRYFEKTIPTRWAQGS